MKHGVVRVPRRALEIQPYRGVGQCVDSKFASITDRGLEHLHGLKQLKTVRLSFTGVSAEGVAELQKALPEATIILK